MMPSFTKEKMLNELRAILAAQAAQISVAKNGSLAAAYLNQKGELYGFDCTADAVDPDHFAGVGIMSEAYEYAFRPTERHNKATVDAMLMEVLAIVRIGYYDGMVINPFLQAQTRYCETVSNTIQARAKLDFEDSPLFLEEVAYLADMLVGSVRNAAKGSGPNVLKTQNLGKRTVIERDEAIRWLKGRRGYVHSPIHGAAPVSAGDISSAQSTGALGKLLTRLRTHQNRTESDLATELSWPAEKLRSWEDGTYRFGIEDGVSLAKALGLDPMILLPKAVELELRREGLA